jgi:hypothetical protein
VVIDPDGPHMVVRWAPWTGPGGYYPCRNPTALRPGPTVPVEMLAPESYRRGELFKGSRTPVTSGRWVRWDAPVG